MARTEFWQDVLAHVQLYIRTQTTLHKSPSQMLVYQVFGLSGPTLRATRDDLIPVQEAVQRELWSQYDNNTHVSKGQNNIKSARLTECRVHAVLADDARLWIQLNLGCNSSRRALQFIVVVQPETNLVAVSGSRSRWTPCVLAAVEASLTCGRGRRHYSLLSAGGGAGKFVLKFMAYYYGCCSSDLYMFSSWLDG